MELILFFFSRILNAIIDYGAGATMAKANESSRLEKNNNFHDKKDLNEFNCPHNCPWTWWAETVDEGEEAEPLPCGKITQTAHQPDFIFIKTQTSHASSVLTE